MKMACSGSSAGARHVVFFLARQGAARIQSVH
jgi:hypothetical protein